ncbi:MAG: SGNH/GDSL hydrolase family protein [Planctomycetota bacterium]
MSAPAARRRPGWKAKVLLLLGAATAALGVGELAVRFYATSMQPRLTVHDDRLGWRHRPNVRRPVLHPGTEGEIAFNEFGHRGAAYPHQRTPGKFRILALGDSFTEALQVGEERVFTRLMERAHPDWEVINAGVGSYGTVQQLLYLRDDGLLFAPDLVLLVWFLNDLADNGFSYAPGLGPRPYADYDGGAVTIVESLDQGPYLRFCAPLPLRGFLARHSYLYQAFNQRVWQTFRAEALDALWLEDRNSFDNRELSAVATTLIQRIGALLEPKGIRFGVALVPAREQAADLDLSFVPWLAPFCESRGIPCRSLRQALHRATADGQQPYFADDIHWTAAGHQVVAAELGPWIQAQRQK